MTGLSNSQRLEHVPARDVSRRPRRPNSFKEGRRLLTSPGQDLDDRAEQQVETCGMPCPVQQDVGSGGFIQDVLAGGPRGKPLKRRLLELPPVSKR